MMRLGVIGPAEGQFFMIFVAFLTAVFGTEFWNDYVLLPSPISSSSSSSSILSSLFSNGVKYNQLLVNFGLFGATLATVENIVYVVRHWRKNSIDPRPGLYSLSALIMYLTFSSLWLNLTYSNFYSTYPLLYFGVIALIICNLITRLIICSVTRSPFSPLQSCFLPCPIILFNSYLSHPLFDEVLLTSAVLAFEFLLYTHYIVSVVNEMCQELGIRAFVLTKKK